MARPPVARYYTTADYVAIVRAAAARGIEVIPEINMPARARARPLSVAAVIELSRLETEQHRPSPQLQ